MSKQKAVRKNAQTEQGQQYTFADALDLMDEVDRLSLAIYDLKVKIQQAKKERRSDQERLDSIEIKLSEITEVFVDLVFRSKVDPPESREERQRNFDIGMKILQHPRFGELFTFPDLFQNMEEKFFPLKSESLATSENYNTLWRIFNERELDSRARASAAQGLISLLTFRPDFISGKEFESFFKFFRRNHYSPRKDIGILLQGLIEIRQFNTQKNLQIVIDRAEDSIVNQDPYEYIYEVSRSDTPPGRSDAPFPGARTFKKKRFVRNLDLAVALQILKNDPTLLSQGMVNQLFSATFKAGKINVNAADVGEIVVAGLMGNPALRTKENLLRIAELTAVDFGSFEVPTPKVHGAILKIYSEQPGLIDDKPADVLLGTLERYGDEKIWQDTVSMLRLTASKAKKEGSEFPTQEQKIKIIALSEYAADKKMFKAHAAFELFINDFIFARALDAARSSPAGGLSATAPRL